MLGTGSSERLGLRPDILQLKKVWKHYGGKAVLGQVTHDFSPGLTLLTGPSGAGKSTLLRLLATAERPTSGVIGWNRSSLPRARRALRMVLGYAPQGVELPETLTAREFILHVAALKGLDLRAADAQFLHVAEELGIHQDANRLIAAFSGGMRRRLVFAQALLGSPRLLVLDEPTAELDAENAGRVADIVQRISRTAIVVMTTHSPDALAQHATVALRVEDGGLHRT